MNFTRWMYRKQTIISVSIKSTIGIGSSIWLAIRQSWKHGDPLGNTQISLAKLTKLETVGILNKQIDQKSVKSHKQELDTAQILLEQSTVIKVMPEQIVQCGQNTDFQYGFYALNRTFGMAA